MIKSSGFYNYAWSPVIGCLNDCFYCYARRDIEAKGQDFRQPVFYEHRLIEPKTIKSPQLIFVTHYCDLMGEWVPKEWVEKIIETIKGSIHTFLFITKNPIRYKEFNFPSNCILGVTIESQDKWNRAETMQNIKGRKMCSIEPIMGEFTGKDFNQFEFLVIGKMMFHKSEFNPEWVRSIIHANIYYQKNVKGCAKV